MLVDEEDKISDLALMDLMAPDCDIFVLDVLKYVSRFGIPLKKDWKYWKTRQKAPKIPQSELSTSSYSGCKVARSKPHLSGETNSTSHTLEKREIEKQIEKRRAELTPSF